MTTDTVYVSPAAVALRWGIDVRTVHRLAARGDLLAVRVGPRLLRIALAAVTAYEEAHSTGRPMRRRAGRRPERRATMADPPAPTGSCP